MPAEYDHQTFVEEYTREHAHDAIKALLYVSEFCDKETFRSDVIAKLRDVERHLAALRNLCA